MEPSSPPYAAELPTGAGERRHACAANDDHGGGGWEDDDDFEFTPLLPQPQSRRQRSSAGGECRPRTAAAACRGTAVVHSVLTQTPPVPQHRAPRRRLQVTVAAKSSAAPAPAPAAARARRVRWHEMAFGSVRVPAAMDMGEIRRRLQARRRRLADDEAAAAAAGWTPWRLIRSLSCKGVEAVAVAAAAAPVRLV